MSSSSKTIEFRSRSEREREILLERNYREIGNRAIAAASQACCKQKRIEVRTDNRAPHDLTAAH
ncbi:hypothetical protein VQ042_04685 [Aurantimonas sp. A2-1-M11]|uniref:hypothetical protein n=1 Tax=Aurantimonas sp. A2-1-M11 TaxID=3113712 RepID=UPI002F91FF42